MIQKYDNTFKMLKCFFLNVIYVEEYFFGGMCEGGRNIPQRGCRTF